MRAVSISVAVMAMALSAAAIPTTPNTLLTDSAVAERNADADYPSLELQERSASGCYT